MLLALYCAGASASPDGASCNVVVYETLARKFYTEVLHEDVISLGSVTQEPVTGCYSFTVNGADRVDISMDARMILYYERQRASSSLTDITVEDIGTTDKAIVSATPAIRWFANTAPLSECVVSRMRGRWRIDLELRYGVQPCRNRDLTVFVSSISGKIQTIVYSPCVPFGNKPSVGLDVDEAKNTADDWIKRQDFFGTKGVFTVSKEAVTLVLAPKENMFSKPDGLGKGPCYYCWEIRYEVRANNGDPKLPVGVWVGVETGEVIGIGPVLDDRNRALLKKIDLERVE